MNVVSSDQAVDRRELLDELRQDVAEYASESDLELVSEAFAFSCDRHEGQRRKSGEEFVYHPWGVAMICARLRQPGIVIAAALLHDTVEDTAATSQEIEDRFGAEVRLLVEGVTKLSKIQFASREEAEAENYRKMILSMAKDIRVIIIKLADRLHNMRTLSYLPKQKQIQKSKEVLEVYAPLAHRLGIHSLKWELEDLAFATLYPRKYAEMEAMVNERRVDREQFVGEAGSILHAELERVGISAQIAGRAKHFYSIYSKMTRRGKEFNEIYDLTAMRVHVDSEKDCYGAIGVIHALWKPVPRRFKDYIAVPKTNGYQSLHTTVIGPSGKPLEIQVRTVQMHQAAEFGVAAHWLYKDKPGRLQPGTQGLQWFQDVVASADDEADADEFMETLRQGLFDEEVYVFTPKGELKALASGSTPLDFAYAVHTDVGHHTVGAKVNGRIVPLSSTLTSGDIVEVMTSKTDRGPSRDWLKFVRTTRARNKIRQYFAREQREDLEARGRESLQTALRGNGLPHQKLSTSPVLAAVMRELGYRRADDFYVAIGSGKLQTTQVTQKILQKLKTDTSVDTSKDHFEFRRRKGGPASAGSSLGIVVDGITSGDVLVRLAKCCTPVPGDEITGYISVGRGITIHRTDCPNARALMRNEERFTPVVWDGDSSRSFRVTVAVDAWDRPRLLEDIGRTFAEHGANVLEYGGHTEDQMCRNWYLIEVADVKTLRSVLSSLRGLDSVFDSFRQTPSSER
jgi:GTP diphosphokinase / guanosine-3',5'-bis(diphosphate) 3'-diphosphatase